VLAPGGANGVAILLRLTFSMSLTSAGERVVRRLAAIPAADVAGYSRLMGRDEHGADDRP
jgi:hypothetical protein